MGEQPDVSPPPHLLLRASLSTEHRRDRIIKWRTLVKRSSTGETKKPVVNINGQKEGSEHKNSDEDDKKLWRRINYLMV
ncbi:hypothetical protein Tcan_03123 [Toxocara canis]|uniref:Uncharacterized protein n=1 Tax=Toxocara canis TaxID=6265 RepID=A0A0B2UYM2_TOXCA|nr:hypothetical protein Tcan_03123 [Toxocara canis]